MKASIKQNQKGSALTILVSLFFIFMMVALVVDAGRLYFEKAQLQTMANGLASDLAENNQACFGERMGSSAPTTISGAKSRLNELYPENKGAKTENKVEVAFADLAIIETEEGKHTISRADSVTRSNGVSVKLTKEINGLIGFTVDKPLTAGATVKKELVSGIGIDSRTASLDTASSPLLGLVFGEILGKDVTLDLVGLNDIAATTTDLSELVASLGLDDPLNSLPADDVLEEVIAATPDLTGNAVNTLDDIVNAAVGNNIVLTDVIQGLGSSSVPDGAKVPALDLVTSIVTNVDDAIPKDININLGKSLGIPGVSDLLDILGVSSTELSLSIDPAPGFVLAAARTDENDNWPVAESSDVTINLKTEAKLTEVLKLIEANLKVDVASAKVEIESSSCASGKNNWVDHVSVKSIERGLLSVEADVDVLKIFGFIKVIGVDVDPVKKEAGTINHEFKNIDLSFYQDQEPKRQAQFNESMVLDDLLSSLLGNIQIKILGLPVPGSDVVADLSDLIDGLLSGLVEPLLNGLGVNLVPVNVTLHSVNQTTVLIEKTYE